MPTVAEAIARAGILDPEMYDEIRKWCLPVEVPEKILLAKSAEEAVDVIREVIESEEQVEVRETIFDMLEQYFKTKRSGTLKLVAPSGQNADVRVSFGRERFGDGYILPWHSEAAYDMLTNGESYLLDGRSKVYFYDARKTFFGRRAAFVVCRPIPKEEKKRGK